LRSHLPPKTSVVEKLAKIFCWKIVLQNAKFEGESLYCKKMQKQNRNLELPNSNLKKYNKIEILITSVELLQLFVGKLQLFCPGYVFPLTTPLFGAAKARAANHSIAFLGRHILRLF